MIRTADTARKIAALAPECCIRLYITACDDRDRQVKREGRNRMSAGYEKPDTTINCWASSGRILSMMFLVTSVSVPAPAEEASNWRAPGRSRNTSTTRSEGGEQYC
jgi:hypothetical protein